MGGTVIAQQPPGVRVAPDQKTGVTSQLVWAFQLLQVLAVGEAGRAVAVATQPEEGLRTGTIEPVPEREDDTHEHEGRKHQPVPCTLARVLTEDAEDERGGDNHPDRAANGQPDDQPAQQNWREDHPLQGFGTGARRPRPEIASGRVIRI